MSTVVFAGPSIFGLDKGDFPAFEFAPPARKGDIWSAALRGAKQIALIDGQFETCPSVWHKEILAALNRGTQIYGAASMGALRAAECHQFGMVGFGRIYEDYASGARTADSDVALEYSPSEMHYAPLTLTMADIEHRLLSSDIEINMTRKKCGKFISAAANIYYKSRSAMNIINLADFDEFTNSEFINIFSKNNKTQKFLDSKFMLDTIGSKDFHIEYKKFNLSTTSYLYDLHIERCQSQKIGVQK
jgi:hypothetical protein